MLMYLLKSSACLAILLLFYKLFLENERMHVFKRYYLLTALVLSSVIPSIVFDIYIEVPKATDEILMPTIAKSVQADPIEITTANDMIDLPLLLWSTYGLGLLLFGFKFLKNLKRIILKIHRNPKYKINSITKVLLSDPVVPHTFFRFIFLNKEQYEKQQIPHAVLLHEETHAKQKHTFDVLFVELLQVILWFNPLIYLVKRAIKLNHEFLADQAVVTKGIETATYQKILLAFSSNVAIPQFSNSINYSSIKKRFTVMKKQSSKKAILLRCLLLLPLTAILLVGFSEKKTIEYSNSEKITEVVVDAPLEVVTEYNELVKKWNVFLDFNMPPRKSEMRRLKQLYVLLSEKQKSIAQPFPDFPKAEKNQNDATIEQLTEYNTLAKVYNRQPNVTRKIPINDLRILMSTYEKMTEEQRSAAEPFPKYSLNQNQEIATKKQVKEYDVLAKKYNRQINKAKNIRINKADLERLEYLYRLMTPAQKDSAEPFPDFPESPQPPTPPSTPAKGEKEMADEIIEEIIANQDPYDVVGGPRIFTAVLSAPAPIVTLNDKYTNNTSAWSLTTGANRDSRKVEAAPPVPPVTPTIGLHVDRDNYSKDLKTAINAYLAANESYEKAVADYREQNKGDQKNLWKIYNGAMEKYVVYYEIAKKEGNFVAPMAANNNRITEVEKSLQDNENVMRLQTEEILEQETQLRAQESMFRRQESFIQAKEQLMEQEHELVKQKKKLMEQKTKLQTMTKKLQVPTPPRPPEPAAPLDHVIEMAKKGARFYYKGQEITSDEAIDILKKDKNLQIDSKTENGKRPVVKLSLKTS